MSQVVSFGPLLCEWRQRRRVSQLDLSLQGNISARHLSFLETDRAQPSRDMVLHLADQLGVPPRDRNLLLTAAGFAPAFRARTLEDPALDAVRKALELVIKGHAPYPALAVDRHWTMVAANDALPRLLGGVDPALLQPPVNVLRVALHPAGLAPHTLNLVEWRTHLLERLRRQTELTADPVLLELLEELRSYSLPQGARAARTGRDYAGVLVPLELAVETGVLSLFSTTTVFGTSIDITVAELALGPVGN